MAKLGQNLWNCLTDKKIEAINNYNNNNKINKMLYIRFIQN